MRKIKIRLAGGLGNQLFEVAFAIHVANINGVSIIEVDDRFLGSYRANHINYLKGMIRANLGEFNIVYKRSIITPLRLPKLISNSQWIPFIGDNTNNLCYRKFTSNVYLDGYFIWKILGNDLSSVVMILKNSLLSTSPIKVDNTCVIHIRGNDFNLLGWNPPDIFKYYRIAIEKMKALGVHDFLIVTDDLVYARKIALKCSLTNINIEKNEMIRDFEIIRNATHKIISGSSFGIWAALLGSDCKNSNVIVSKGNAQGLSDVLKLSNVIAL